MWCGHCHLGIFPAWRSLCTRCFTDRSWCLSSGRHTRERHISARSAAAVVVAAETAAAVRCHYSIKTTAKTVVNRVTSDCSSAMDGTYNDVQISTSLDRSFVPSTSIPTTSSHVTELRHEWCSRRDLEWNASVLRLNFWTVITLWTIKTWHFIFDYNFGQS